jgi:hypothetical protein
MRPALILALSLPLCAFAADTKPDFTVTAEEFSKEAETNKDAFRQKYKNKVVEVTGTVWTTRVPRGDVLLNGYKKDPKDFVPALVSCMPSASLEAKLRSLAKGQQVTLRGTQVDAGFPGLEKCEFVKVGPSPAVAVTVSSLAEEFKKDRAAADRKYDAKSVVVRAKVVTAEKDTTKKVMWIVTDADGKGTVKIPAWADSFLNDKFLKQLEQVKKDDVIILMGEAQSLGGDPCRLWDCVVLKEPPDGVKLPGDKK